MSMIGKTLAHYEITSQLGKGGMGEVYQAKDRKLGRDVAIKVLPGEFAKDANRVSRFQREAKLLASLNHTNIAAIYGLEASDQTNFLVLELVEGDTLADRIKIGPIPVEESLKLALQIAEALEAAHEKGVIHRDLKPANIKVTPDGKVKVLDFGLAKAFTGEQEQVNLSNSPTLSDAATQQGVILGTAAYMSPEQARGKSVDKRADIWAFGCVLFEMLTGRAPFSGKDVTDILAAVIRAEPEWNSLPANLHGRLREVLERCLQKDAKDRYRDISDVKVDIQRVLTDPSGVLVQPVMAAEPKKMRTMLPWFAAILGIIIVGVGIWNLRKPEPRQVMRFTYELPEGQQFGFPSLPVLAVSPDGKQFVYSTTNGLYIRSVDELTAKLIAGTEGSTQQPFFSPDGKSIGYFSASDRQLKKIAISGGAPVTLCAVNQLMGAWWGADNTIVYGQLADDMMRISGNGGNPESLVKMKSELLILPQILPGGKSVLYTAAASVTKYRTMVQSLKSGEPKELFAGGMGQYLPTGHIVYRLPNNNNLFAVAFDLDKLEVKGGPVPTVEGVGQAAVSDAGTLAYVPATTSGATQSGRILVWVDRKGNEEPLKAPPNPYQTPKISPDGTKVAVTVAIDGNKDIWVWDPVRETMTRLTFDKTAEQQPIWAPDGKRIAFMSYEGDKGGIYLKAADGTGESETLGSAPNLILFPWSWSRDGKTLAIVESRDGLTRYDIGILSTRSDHTPKLLLHGEYTETNPNISPDGKYIAYMSAESGDGLIYVRPFPETNKGRWQISTGYGETPLWSPDCRELFYFSNEGVMQVPIDIKPTFNAGKPRVLFRGPYVNGYGDAPSWDISPDGKRFLMMKEAGSTAPGEALRKINIVVNWFEELKQRVPVK